MVYAIELYFDKETEEKLMSLARGIEGTGIKNRYLDWGTRPHITLGLFNDIKVDECNKLLKEIADKMKSFPAKMSSIGVFNNTGCVFISPVINEGLFELQRRVHEVFSFCDHTGFEYYLPGSWVPHCAVMLGDSDNDDLSKAAKYVIENYEPVEGSFCEVSFVEITMPVKEHHSYKFHQQD